MFFCNWKHGKQALATCGTYKMISQPYTVDIIYVDQSIPMILNVAWGVQTVPLHNAL